MVAGSVGFGVIFVFAPRGMVVVAACIGWLLALSLVMPTSLAMVSGVCSLFGVYLASTAGRVNGRVALLLILLSVVSSAIFLSVSCTDAPLSSRTHV